MTPRTAVLKALEEVPEAVWVTTLWSVLAGLEVLRTEGLHLDYAALQLKGAIVAEFKALDALAPHGTPERP